MSEPVKAAQAEIDRPFKLNAKQEQALAFMTDPVARHTLLLGGSRCLGGETLIDTASGPVRLSRLFRDGKKFDVRSLSNGGADMLARAEAPFLKGTARLLRIELEDGSHFDAHPVHRVICKKPSGFCWALTGDLAEGDMLLSSWAARLSSPSLPESSSERAISERFEHGSMFAALNADPSAVCSRIVRIRLKEQSEEYYDFTVPTTAIYSAGGCYHHNSGKSFLCVWAIIIRALTYPKSRHLCLRLHRVTAEKYLWKQTMRDVIEKCFKGVGFVYNNSRMILTCPNGSTVWMGGLDEGENSDGLLGSDWNTIHFDEANEMLAEGMQKARTRLSLRSKSEDGARLCVNRSFATVNPTYKTHHLYKTYVEKIDIFRNLPMEPEIAAMYNWCRINPADNLENLSEDYLKELNSLSEANKRRFLEGEWSEESKDALFKLGDINRNRVKTWAEVAALKFDKVVVGVDPAATSGNKADMTGIVVVGWIRPGSGDRRSSGQYFVLEDRSLVGTPDDWAQAVYDAYCHWKADLIVGEANNGGDLVEKNIRSVSRVAPYKKVWASRGKAIRAQPVVSLNERGDLHVAVCLPELEGEMVGWNPDLGGPSPNRMDAMVWAVTECMGAKHKVARIVGAV